VKANSSRRATRHPIFFVTSALCARRVTGEWRFRERFLAVAALSEAAWRAALAEP
jgi:hypothetical protein